MKRFILPLLVLLFVGSLFAVESDPSDVVGYVKYDLVAGNNMIAIPLDCPWGWASDLGMELGEGVVDQISIWNPIAQAFEAAADLGGFWDGDFELESGIVLMINSYDPITFYSLGDLPTANASYDIVAGNNTVMIPLNRSDLAWASDLGMEMGEGIVDIISVWNSTAQAFEAAADLGGFWDGDFELSIGQPLMVNSYDTFTWPNRSVSNSLRQSK